MIETKKDTRYICKCKACNTKPNRKINFCSKCGMQLVANPVIHSYKMSKEKADAKLTQLLNTSFENDDTALALSYTSGSTLSNKENNYLCRG